MQREIVREANPLRQHHALTVINREFKNFFVYICILFLIKEISLKVNILPLGMYFQEELVLIYIVEKLATGLYLVKKKKV